MYKCAVSEVPLCIPPRPLPHGHGSEPSRARERAVSRYESRLLKRSTKRGLVMRKIVVMSVAGLGVWMGAANAQFGRGAADWVTNGGDAQRSFWIRTDAKISKDSLEKPGFQFLWKVKFAGALAAPVMLDRYIGYRGFRSLGFMGSGSNGVYAVDIDLRRVEWQKQLSPEVPRPSGSAGCAVAFIADLTRPAPPENPSASAGPQGIGGRGGAARRAGGEPPHGAATPPPP